MTFKKAYDLMKQGRKVKRPGWKGYWFIDPTTDMLTIHLASGENIIAGEFKMTIENTLADDWVVLEDENQ